MKVIWSNASVENLKRVQRLQNKVLKAIYGLPYDLPTKTLYENIQHLKFDKLRTYEQCKLIYNLEHHLIKNSTTIMKNNEFHTFNTRNAQKIRQKSIRTNIGLRAPTYSSIKEYNSLPPTITGQPNFLMFCKTLKTHLLNEQNCMNLL